MMRPVVASGQLSFSEYFNVVRAESLRQAWLAVSLCGLLTALSLCLILYAAVVVPEDLGSILWSVWEIPVILSVTIGILLFNFRRRARKQLSSSRELSGEATYEFSDTGFDTRTHFSSSTSTWEALHGARESREAFIFYRSNASFHIVPKRTFKSPGDIDALREIIRSRVSGKVKLLKQRDAE